MKPTFAHFGELAGTFILVFIGCSTVALSVLSMAFPTLFQVAIVWGVGVALAIYATRKYCPAHLNPAVSIGEFLHHKISISTLIGFILFQFIGAILAGIAVYFIFNSSIASFEAFHHISRGELSSNQTAKIFGEFFPNPGSDIKVVSHATAMIAEGIGTFILMIVIFLVGNTQRKVDIVAPLIIGATVTIIIIFIAPYTQGGFNPARDFGPRLVAYFGGWGSSAFPAVTYSFLTVYILSPIAGAIGAFFAFKLIVK